MKFFTIIFLAFTIFGCGKFSKMEKNYYNEGFFIADSSIEIPKSKSGEAPKQREDLVRYTKGCVEAGKSENKFEYDSSLKIGQSFVGYEAFEFFKDSFSWAHTDIVVNYKKNSLETSKVYKSFVNVVTRLSVGDSEENICGIVNGEEVCSSTALMFSKNKPPSCWVTDSDKPINSKLQKGSFSFFTGKTINAYKDVHKVSGTISCMDLKKTIKNYGKGILLTEKISSNSVSSLSPIFCGGGFISSKVEVYLDNKNKVYSHKKGYSVIY